MTSSARTKTDKVLKKPTHYECKGYTAPRVGRTYTGKRVRWEREAKAPPLKPADSAGGWKLTPELMQASILGSQRSRREEQIEDRLRQALGDPECVDDLMAECGFVGR